jgi:hypothetical protein
MDPPPAQEPQRTVSIYDAPRARSTTMKKSSSRGGFSPIHLLPFGAGQYYNGSTMLGLVFTGAEIGALAVWYINNQYAEQTAADTSKVIAELEKSEQYGRDEAFTNEVKQYHAAAKAEVQNSQTQAMYGIYAFGALWATGVVESIINAPEPKNERRPKKRKTMFSLTPQGAAELAYKWEF